jgi:hypothetical protein
MMTTTDATGRAKTGNSTRIILVLAIAAFFAVATHQHLFSVNSQYYYTWTWKWINPRIVYPVLLALAIPFFVGMAIYQRQPKRLGLALALILVAKFVMMLGAAAVQDDPPSLHRIVEVTRSRWTTGYFDEAATLQKHNLTIRELLTRYPTLLGHFYLHERQKPPGPLLFETAIVRIIGATDAGAMASGILIGILATLAVLAVYGFIAFFTGNRDAAFFGASYFTLCPAPILFFPQFDQCYAILTFFIPVLWALCLERNRFRYSAALGFMYAVASFITYASGALAIFLMGYGLLKYLTDSRCGLSRILAHFAISVAVFAASYLLLWAVTGFNPIATFRACVDQEHLIAVILVNVYHYHHHGLPGTILTDLYDFALGSGWISFVLAAFYFKPAAKGKSAAEIRIAPLCVAQFVVVALIGLLPTETARIWMFMLPMLMLPIGLELARWGPGQRLAVYVALLVLLVLMCQSMEFIGGAM